MILSLKARALLIAGIASATLANAQAPAPTSTVAYSTLYNEPNGESHFRDGRSLELILPGSAERADGDMYFHTMEGVTSVMLTRLRAGMTEDWHPSPQRMLVFGLEGEVEMTASDGNTRVVGPGDILLLEDTRGRGHLTHVPGDVDYVGLGILISDDAFAADPAGSGPEPAIAYSERSLPTHTIYRPAALKGEYPVVLWANGGCVNSNFGYREFLAEVASHGFIVLAIGPYRDTPETRAELSANPAEWPPFETHYSLMLDALDWITAENDRPASPFFKKIEGDKVAVMGHSCGGLQTIKASIDPRISTALVLNSGMMADDDQYMVRHELERSVLQEMHAPIAYFIGGESDIAHANSEMDWREIEQLDIDAINANLDVGHGATYDSPHGGAFAEGPLAWLQWQLKDDAKARATFVGDRCGFCVDSDWVLRRHLATSYGK